MVLKIFSRSKSAQKHRDAPDTPDAHDGSLDIESLAEGAVSQDQDSGSASTKGRSYLETLYPDAWTTRFECMGELIVDRRADASDILYVNPTVRGLSILCGIKDLGSFIASLPTMPKLESWALIHG